MDDVIGGRPEGQSLSDLLTLWVEGDAGAGDRLFSLLYQELRELARRQLRHRPRDGTLDSTALIHEAYLKLMEGARSPVRDRGHFLALASRVMRQILVDYARRKNAVKRGGGRLETLPEDAEMPAAAQAEDLLSLDEALTRLESLEPRLARLVDLRFFGGLSAEETSQALEISVATVKREWTRARAFLLQQMQSSPNA